MSRNWYWVACTVLLTACPEEIGGPGEPCSRQDTCREGLVCVEGTCRERSEEQDAGSISSDAGIPDVARHDLLLPDTSAPDLVTTDSAQADLHLPDHSRQDLGGVDASVSDTTTGGDSSLADATGASDLGAGGDITASQDASSAEDATVSSCDGVPDFTPCHNAATPDLSYDVCMEDSCVSPGCGFVSCNTTGPHFTLPDTNVTTCYNNTMSTPPPGTAGDPSCGSTPFCGQDAQYGWDTQHQSDERFTVLLDDPNQPVVVDEVTSLVWQGCVAGRSGSDCSDGGISGMDWETAVDYCETLIWGGLQDWRLPDMYELYSIGSWSEVPAISATAFPRTNEMYWYWTSTAQPASAEFSSMVVSFGAGANLLRASLTIGEYGCRCVRGGAPQSTAPRFVQTLGATSQINVEDAATGLTWQGCMAGQTGLTCLGDSPSRMNWEEALTYCEDLSWGGADDWRLPNVLEWITILDGRHSNPAYRDDVFPGFPMVVEQNAWTSTTITLGNQASFVSLSVGQIVSMDKTQGYWVRCLR